MNEFEVHGGGVTLRPLLLVEDNPMDVDLTLQAFDENGIVNPIVVCRDGEDALRYVEAHDAADDPQLPLLVLLDLRMPNVDGLSVLRAMRARTTWKVMPVVVLTTSSEDEDIARSYVLGANSYIVKPVDWATFTGVVKTIKLYWLLTNQSPFPPRKGRP